MSEVPDFEDKAATAEWLQSRPREVAIAVASRAALRSLPALSDLFDVHARVETPSANLLPLLRALLTSSVSVFGTPPLEAREDAVGDDPLLSAADAATDAVTMTSGRATAGARAAAGAASAAIRFTAAGRANEVSLATGAARIAATRIAGAPVGEAAERATAFDARLLASNPSPGSVFDVPLWHGNSSPLQRRWSALRRHIEHLGPNWQFWIDWYERHLRGSPQNWPLLGRIALLPGEDWEQGPAHIAAEIERLKREAEPEARAAVRSAAHEAIVRLESIERGIGDNNPPESLAEDTFRRDVAEVTTAIRALAEESSKNRHDDVAVDRVPKEVETLRAWLEGIGAFSREPAEKFAVGFWAAAGGAGFVVVREAVLSIYKMASVWLQTLP